MEMQRRGGPIIYSSPCDNLSVLVVKEANHENFAAHEDPLLHDRLQELAIYLLVEDAAFPQPLLFFLSDKTKTNKNRCFLLSKNKRGFCFLVPCLRAAEKVL